MRRTVIAHQIVHIDCMYLTGLHRFDACRPGYDLFPYCHAHTITLLFQSRIRPADTPYPKLLSRR